MKLVAESKWHITGRGDIYVIDLKKNDLPLYRKEWSKLLMNKEVEIEDKKFTVRGIEAFALADGCRHQSIGLQVKEMAL
jgi:hypothetical protein